MEEREQFGKRKRSYSDIEEDENYSSDDCEDCPTEDQLRKNRILKKYKRLCEFASCYKQASFGPVGGKKVRCKTHKLTDDFNNRIKRCEKEGCDKSPSFGPVEDIKVFRCKQHKLPSDINKTNTICTKEGCGKTASFGIEGGPKLSCFIHKKQDFINLKKLKKID